MDTDKIMGLVRMEVLIYRYYNQLCQREIMKQYGPGFTNFIELLNLNQIILTLLWKNYFSLYFIFITILNM